MGGVRDAWTQADHGRLHADWATAQCRATGRGSRSTGHHNRPADAWVQRGQQGSRATRRSRHSAPEVMMAMSGANTANSVMARMNRFQGSESSRQQPACGRVSGASRAWWVHCWQQGRPNVVWQRHGRLLLPGPAAPPLQQGVRPSASRSASWAAARAGGSRAAEPGCMPASLWPRLWRHRRPACCPDKCVLG